MSADGTIEKTIKLNYNKAVTRTCFYDSASKRSRSFKHFLFYIKQNAGKGKINGKTGGRCHSKQQ